MFFFFLAIVTHINAQQAGLPQMASLRPHQELRWHRVSPNTEHPDGPVLYQLLFNASGTPGTVPVFDSNPRHLINSPITVGGGNVAIGGLSISGGTGIITFANGQTFPANSRGTVTSLSAGAGITLSPSPITTTGSISIADGGVTAAKIGSGPALNGEVLVANGSGNANWQRLNYFITNAWDLGGNTGTGCTTSPCMKFLGTMDNSALELDVTSERAFRIEPATDKSGSNFGFSPNIIGGFSGNAVRAAGVAGATIAGGGAAGNENTVSASFSSVGGGLSNASRGTFSAVVGGFFNTTGGSYSTVGGGISNRSVGIASTVAGGQSNTASGNFSFAAGSYTDTNNHSGSFVWGDSSTTTYVTASADNQFAARASGGFQFITGVDGNGNPDPAKTVSIAPNSGMITFVPGQTFPGVNAWNLGGNIGTGCTTSPCLSFLGTTDNSALEFQVNSNRVLRVEPATDTQTGRGSSPNVIAGFSGNAITVAGTAGATIAGGGAGIGINRVSASFGSVGGGSSNTASGTFSTVAGGSVNTAGGATATVAGGEGNTASGTTSTVAGGQLNTASGGQSTVAGGEQNIASGSLSTVAGGNSNTASGNYSTAAGGYGNIASGDFSFAAGHTANTNHHAGAFVWGDNSSVNYVMATADNQFMARSSGGVVFYTNSGLTAGVQVAPGGGSWASVSDRNVKANFAAIDSKQILARLVALPITTWNYKTQVASIRHIGPMAQDFFAAFNVGEDDRHITDIDEGGVALAAIQGLNQKLEEELRQKETRLAAAENEIHELKIMVQDLVRAKASHP